MKYLQNEARKQKSVKEITQFSVIFQIRLKNNTVNFRVICPLINTPNYWAAYGQRKTTNKNKKGTNLKAAARLSPQESQLSFLPC
jgi:hypothetical protein